jgi:hypothetical protein
VIRRTVIVLLPALIALTVLCGLPAQSADGRQVTSADWNKASVVSLPRAFFEETNNQGLSKRADDQDEPDRIATLGEPTNWPHFTPNLGRHLTGRVATRTHRACAFPATGPPTS